MKEIAKDFLARSFAPGSTIALLLRTESTAKTQQRVVTLEQALAPRYLGWLAHQNHHGANIYVAANPLRCGSRRRTKECIASVRHLCMDIDDDGDARLAALRASDGLPVPSTILSTSPGKYQVLWRVDRFDFAQQEDTLKRLAVAFGGDPACTDCNRVLRIPGFLNQKYSPAHFVAVEYPSDATYSPAAFRLPEGDELAALPLRGNARHAVTHKDSHSERDWAWACHELAQGKDAGKLTHELASRRSDKPNPLYYARRTIDIASARQSFLEGALVDDIIATLIDRRHSELPNALCSARAREIAATAQRMVAHHKNAYFQTQKETLMPLLEVVQTRQISASIRLTDSTATQVDQYAAFIRATADDVVEQALAYVFSKDRDFQDFLKSPDARKVTRTLRIRKPAANEVADPAVKRQSLPAQAPPSVAGSKA